MPNVGVLSRNVWLITGINSRKGLFACCFYFFSFQFLISLLSIQKRNDSVVFILCLLFTTARMDDTDLRMIRTIFIMAKIINYS